MASSNRLCAISVTSFCAVLSGHFAHHHPMGVSNPSPKLTVNRLTTSHLGIFIGVGLSKNDVTVCAHPCITVESHLRPSRVHLMSIHRSARSAGTAQFDHEFLAFD